MSDKGYERMEDALVRAVAALEKIAESLEIIAAAEKKGSELADTLTAFYDGGKE